MVALVSRLPQGSYRKGKRSPGGWARQWKSEGKSPHQKGDSKGPCKARVAPWSVGTSTAYPWPMGRWSVSTALLRTSQAKSSSP